MKKTRGQQALRTPCKECPLRSCEQMREFTAGELSFMETFKKGELIADRGATILAQGNRGFHLYTILSGMGFRYKLLDDGRRQILNYVFPGDLIGLQATLIGEMQHSVEALTPMKLCVFEKDRISDLYRNHSGLAYDITWIAAREERILDEHLLSIGRRSALERSAYLLAFLDRRNKVGRLSDETASGLPITQAHVADTLGLSIVHTNKTLRKLQNLGLVRWMERGCEVRSAKELRDIAGWEPQQEVKRPFL